ncbi:hypothetical protein VM1G_01799 [Cytospora mali]|uniref:Uncharacterized protein n=1 Tax=Cytospora mali TaxID=578113 RepID=A0A194VPA0_CYTMA|nr:hypothetical protein VM1G_01799 [Valsa mali]
MADPILYQLLRAGDCGSRVWLLLLPELIEACWLALESQDLTDLVRELLCVGDLLTTARTGLGLCVGDCKGAGVYMMRSGSEQTLSVSGTLDPDAPMQRTYCDEALLLSPHFRLPRNNSAAIKATRHSVPAMLTPAIAPFDRPGELVALAEVIVLVGVVTELELVVEEVLVELTVEPLVVDVDIDVAVAVGVDDTLSNTAALFALLDSSAATRLLVGQPSSLLQALLEQHPRKGVSKPEHVYQWAFPEQAWVLMFSYSSASKLEYLRSVWGQLPEPSAHGSVAQHPRNWILLT